MKLRIVHYSSPDVENLWAWQPSIEDTYLLLELQIEDEEAASGNVFSVIVATPEALRSRRKSHFVLSQRGTLVVSEYDWGRLRAHLEQLVANCSASGWATTVDCLRRYFLWEYESAP